MDENERYGMHRSMGENGLRMGERLGRPEEIFKESGLGCQVPSTSTGGNDVNPAARHPRARPQPRDPTWDAGIDTGAAAKGAAPTGMGSRIWSRAG